MRKNGGKACRALSGGIMELRYIEIFCTVVELKSFSKAAQALHLTQPTISVHIKALEDEFSTKLLDRLGRTILPTQDGEILYRYAKEIVTLKENARRAMEKVTGTVSGKLVIGASTIPGEYILPQLLAKFKRAYPDVFPTLRIGDSNDIYESVLRGEVDLGVIGKAVKDKNVVTRKYLGDEIILAAPANYKTSVLQKEECKTVPLLVRENGSGSRSSLEENLNRIGLSLDNLNIVAEIGSSQALIRAVKCGMGLAFTSRLSVQDEIDRGTLKAVKLKGILVHRNFYVITHRLRFNSLICRSFIRFLTGAEEDN
jgi:DNA-binding transcriptional LysR family regulator